jgi:hypothetical protein
LVDKSGNEHDIIAQGWKSFWKFDSLK